MFQTKKITSKIENITSWNNTYSNEALVYFPKNQRELISLIKRITKKKIRYIVKTGKCSYDSKSINSDDETTVISLKKLRRLISLNKKNKTIKVEAGALISDIVKELKEKNYTIYSIPGGEFVSVGGAVSANVIGKDSSKKIASFGDAVESIKILTEKGNIKILKKNSREMKNFIGAFGLSGIMIEIELKVRKIKSKNLIVHKKSLNSLNEIKKELDKKSDYKYVQIDPFFREKNFAVVFGAYFSNNKNSLYKNINLKSYFFERFFFKISSFFINKITWKMFYSIFFLFNKNKKIEMDLHNYHYSSKYKHLIPLTCRNGLVDYEILIKKNFNKKIRKIISLIKKQNLIPIYIVVKKVFKSKNKFFYSFNDNGYAVAISLNKTKLSDKKADSIKNLLLKEKLELNLSKTDEKLIKNKGLKNNLFMSLYKKMIVNNYEISR